MRKFIEIISGIVSVLPLLYIVGFIGVIVSIATSPPDQSPLILMGTSTDSLFLTIDRLFVLHGAAMLVTLGQMLAYVVHALRVDYSSAMGRAVWALLLLMGNVLVFPIYWYFMIARKTDPFTSTPMARR